jgi:hypothetical protein
MLSWTLLLHRACDDLRNAGARLLADAIASVIRFNSQIKRVSGDGEGDASNRQVRKPDRVVTRPAASHQKRQRLAVRFAQRPL